MRRVGRIAAAVALCSGTIANAQAANQAFECTLPYKATMEALAALTVTGQSSDPGNSLLLKPASQTVEFAPGATRVFGAAPTKLSFTAAEPLDDLEPLYAMTFTAILPSEDATHRAIVAANPWHLTNCTEGLAFCIRADSAEPEGIGKLVYYREFDEPFSIECTFQFTPEEFEALGE